jgi:U3 small nucleolar RNA-associated protein 20
MKFKLKFLVPHGDCLQAMIQKGGLRNAMLKLGGDVETGKVVDEHRKLLIPVLTRILFGRLTAKGAKSSKDSPAARRAAVLSFLSSLCKSDTDLFPIVYSMTRGFIPKIETLNNVESYDESDRQRILDTLLSTKADDLAQVPTHVIEGFLHLLSTAISQLGHRLVHFVPQLASIVVALCGFAAVRRENGRSRDDSVEDEDEREHASANEEELGGGRNASMSSIRTLCYNRLSELFLRFGGCIDFGFLSKPLWKALENSIKLLPEMVVKSEKSPALLSLLETMSTEAQLVELLDVGADPAYAVIKCIAGTSQTSVISSSLSFVENLLTVEGDVSGPDSGAAGAHLVQKHLPLLLEQFSLRLQGGVSQESGANNAVASSSERARFRQSPTWRRELSILCRLSEMIDDKESDRLKNEACVLERLCALLLSFLDPCRSIQDDDKMNVISILKGIVPQLGGAAAKPVFQQLSKALAPCNAKVGIESLQVRRGIASLFTIVSGVNNDFKDVADAVNGLSAVHPRRVDEIGYDIVIPVLNDLCDTSDPCAWTSLGGEERFDRTVLAPVVNVCFHFLHSNDGVISRAAFNALKSVVTVASRRSVSIKKNSKNLEDIDEWAKLVETSIIPLAKAGLHSRDVSVRRNYVLLIREITKFFDGQSSPHLLGDLGVLYNDENPDLDFFVNITHVQIHRRARGLQRLRKIFNDNSAECSTCPIGPQSLSNVVLPLVLHPVFECSAKSEETYALEAIATIGAVSRFLTWKKYHATLWTVLNQFDRNAGRERYMVALVCAIIDGFRFELVSTPVPENESDNVFDENNTKTAVWRALEKRVIPKIEGLLIKEKVDKRGTRIKTIRAAILLALLKLYQRFPERFFESRLPRLLAVICDSLANKDSDVRDVARTTLGKMVVSMDLKYFADVIREVSITLHEGFKLHVRAATIHTVLQMVSTVYTPPSEDSSDPQTLWFDKCVPALMSVIQDDLFGMANERRQSRETNVRYVKEAGGSKSVNSIEIMCRLIRFKPSEANQGSVSESSIHCVVSPLLERLRLPDVDNATIRKIREILARVVIGLAHNPSVQPVELLPFVFATVQPFIGADNISSLLEETNIDEEEDEDHDASIRVSGSTSAKGKKTKKSKGAIVEWRPSTLGTSKSARDATDRKLESSKELMKVSDGASAPKLTGSGRHGDVSSQTLNSPASISAVVFGLNILHSSLKSMTVDEVGGIPAMMDPFVSLLTGCVCHCRDVDVLVVAFKCIVAMLRFKLPSFDAYSKLLGSKTLEFLTSSGSSLNQNQDLIQACFKTLAYLINTKRDSSDFTEKLSKPTEGEDALAANIAMPLTSDQMKVLISILQVALAEAEQHNPALALIKAIMSRKYVSPEFYDLMASMLKLVVRSQKPSLRQVNTQTCWICRCCTAISILTMCIS